MIRKKTKIICTLGPSSDTSEAIGNLIKAGMDCARLNFSHGSYDMHYSMIQNVRIAAEKTGVFIPILQDLSGPKIRVGMLDNDAVELKNGEEIFITQNEIKGNSEIISTTYPEIIRDVNEGEIILLDDGNLKLVVKKIFDDKILCKISAGGILKQRKGINLPDTKISLPTLTEKDYRDIDFGIKNGVDFFALSFVRSPEDITTLRGYINKNGYDAPLIAKIERPEAIKYIDEIIDVSDMVMVARGDLGVEVSPEDVPVLQKMIIRKCNEKRTPVITATQMLESMITSTFPTRAEATDVANAILDGTDCVMLSAESSVGKHPELVVETMDRIIEKAESIKKSVYDKPGKHLENADNTLEAVCNSAVEIACSTNAKAIFTLTKTGKSPLLLSNHRPKCSIISASTDNKILMKSALMWGVEPIQINNTENLSEVKKDILESVMKKKILLTGDKAVLILSLPLEISDSANTIQVVEV